MKEPGERRSVPQDPRRDSLESYHSLIAISIRLLFDAYYGVVVIAVSEEGVGAEDIEPAAVAQDSGPGGIVIGVLKGDSAAGLDGFVDNVHDVIAALVVGLRAGVDIDVAIKLLRLGLRGQTAR